jgi:hypothetical protein
MKNNFFILLMKVVFIGCILLALYGLSSTKDKEDMPITNVDLQTFTKWSKRFNDNDDIGPIIKQSIKDGVITKSEYIKVLYMVVDYNEKELEVEKNNMLCEIKNNTKDIK